MSQVIVLNGDGQIMNTVSVNDALKYIYLGKVKVIKVIENIPRVVQWLKVIVAMHKAGVHWTRRNVHVRDKFTCQYCGVKILSKKVTVDHIMPRSRGGKNSFENTVCCCFKCNNKKGDRTPNEAGMSFFKRGFRPYKPSVMEFYMMKFKADGLEQTLVELGVY